MNLEMLGLSTFWHLQSGRNVFPTFTV